MTWETSGQFMSIPKATVAMTTLSLLYLRTAKLTDDVFFGGIISNVCKHVDYIPNNAFQKEKCF